MYPIIMHISDMKKNRLDISKMFCEVSFTDHELALLIATFKEISLPKGSMLLHATELVKYQYYVIDGCLRTFFVDKHDKEHTIQFGINDWWVSDYTAFFSSSNALLNIECLKDTTLVRVSRVDMKLLYKEIPVLKTFFLRKMEGAFASFQHRIVGSLSQSAKDRYMNFMSSYPNIEQCVKNYHIASYLGITTATLSRIRRDLADH